MDDDFAGWLARAVAPLGSRESPRDRLAARAAACAFAHRAGLADARRELEAAFKAGEKNPGDSSEMMFELSRRPRRRRGLVVARLEAVAGDGGAPAAIRQAARLAVAGFEPAAAARVAGSMPADAPGAALVRDVADGLAGDGDAVARALRNALEASLAPAATGTPDHDEKPGEAAPPPARATLPPAGAAAQSDGAFIRELDQALAGEAPPIGSAADLARRAGRDPATFQRALKRSGATGALTEKWVRVQTATLAAKAGARTRADPQRARGDPQRNTGP